MVERCLAKGTKYTVVIKSEGDKGWTRAPGKSRTLVEASTIECLGYSLRSCRALCSH